MTRTLKPVPAPEPYRPKRAQRFPVSLPLLYRRPGDSDWHEGTAENLSCSGVFFYGRYLIEAETPVEIALHIPYELSGGALVHLGCFGRVVRVAPKNGQEYRGMGAAVVDFRLLYPQHKMRSLPGDDHMAAAQRHGINNLLEVVLGYSNLLMHRTDLPAEAVEQIEKIQSAARDAAAMVHWQTRRKQTG